MASGRQQGSSKPVASDQELDPNYDWQENATSFVLRIHLSGFRKQDFRVQVDGTGRLTVRGQRADADNKRYRLNKVFQLPATSNLDDITGRFEAGVLALTVPKKASTASPPAAATIEDIKGQPGKHQQLQEPANNKQAKAAEDSAVDTKKPDAASCKKPAAAENVDANKRGQPEQEQQRKPAAPPADKKQSAGAPSTDDKKLQAAGAPPADDKKQADAAERKAADPADSLAERARRRAEEEERAKPAAAAAPEESARPAAPGRGFRERVVEELQGLAGSEWAEGLVDTVKKNREVIAVAVAAFSIGLFVSSRLFSRNSN